MLKNLKLRSKVLIILLFIAIMTAGIVGLIAFTLGKNALEKESFNKLTAIRELKAHQIENYFELIFDQVSSLSESMTVIEATLQFNQGFYNLNNQVYYSDQELISIDSSLLVYYQDEFIDKLFYRDSAINYFSIPSQELQRGQELWLNTVKAGDYGESAWKEFPKLRPSDFEGNLVITGSSTVASLANHIIDLFQENGALGDISYSATGTDSGLQDLAINNKSYLTGASHSLSDSERELFEGSGLKPITFRIGTDALLVAVGKSNQFLADISREELEKVFSSTEKWSDINPGWPDKKIKRFIPAEGSGSYKVFSNLVLDGDQKALINLPNTQIIKDGSEMNEAFEKDPYSIAFFSYNYYKKDSPLKLLSIDGISLNNNTIRRDQYQLTRPLFLVTTKQILSKNRNVATLLNFFLNAIDDEIGVDLGKSDYWPQHVNHRILQYQYIVDNPYPKGEKDNLISTNLNTDYNKAHEIYHPILKNYLDRFGYYDIFLVDADSGHIIYSTSKEVDFATDILQGAYSNTGISRVFMKVIENDDPTAVCFEDFKPYPPSYNAPASFIASSIINNGKVIGVLIFQLPIDKINHIMTDGYEWSAVGLGKTGETYLVGEDFLMRNQSRFLVEDPEEYLKMIERTGISRETIAKIRSLKSSIGLQPIRTLGTEQAIKGNSGTQIFNDYRETEVLSAYRPLNIEGLKWVIMSEKDKSEAFAAIDAMAIRFAYWFIALLIFILVLSFAFARSISKPLQMLTQRASGLANGNLDDSVKLEQTDEIGALAENFEFMRISVKKLVDDLNDVNEGLERQVKQRTKELNRAKEAADAILDKSPVPVAVVDISTASFIRVNKAMCEFNGLNESELLQRATLDIYFDPENDRPIILDQLREFGKVEAKEVRSKRIDTGEERWTIINIHPITYLDKDVYITTMIDITERKLAEEDLFAANQRFQAIVDNLADGLIIIDVKGIIQFYSPSAEKLFQYTQDEVRGKNITRLMGSPHRENHANYLQNYMDTGVAKIIGNEREVEAVRKDGSVFPARLMISEIRRENNVLFVGLIGDLSDRKKAERQLKTQAAAMESAGNGIVITNPLGIIQWVNPAFHELTGYQTEEVIGNNPSILKSGKHDDSFYDHMWETITKGEVWHDEVINKKKNGDLYYEEMTLTPVFDDKGNITQFVAIKQDVTERKRLEAIVLKAKERMEGELNVAKDIQMSMLPLIFPAFPKRNEIDLYAELIPAREVGGDFYDFYFLDENHFCFVIGDVSGKGVPAALMMAVTKTLLKSQAVNDRSTASILTHVNNEIAKDNDTYMFITVFMAILDTNTGELVYSNAGHNPSYILNNKNKGHIKLGDLHGPVVGAMEEMTYKETKLNINKDDLIVVYTDGITESQNINEELYSDEKFIQLLESESMSSPKDLIKKIIDSVKSFEGEAEQFDDITLLAIRYLQEPNTISSDKTSIKIKNDLKQITEVIDHFEVFGEKNNIPFPIIQKFNIAFDELLNNNISYGFKDNAEHIIDVDIELKGSRLIITITDDGMPFNPFVKNPPDTKLSVSERDIGGLGIHIVKNLMDEFDYKRSADKNIITLIKHNINT